MTGFFYLLLEFKFELRLISINVKNNICWLEYQKSVPRTKCPLRKCIKIRYSTNFRISEMIVRVGPYEYVSKYTSTMCYKDEICFCGILKNLFYFSIFAIYVCYLSILIFISKFLMMYCSKERREIENFGVVFFNTDGMLGC